MGPGDSKLLCGPTTIIEGKERCDRKGNKRTGHLLPNLGATLLTLLEVPVVAKQTLVVVHSAQQQSLLRSTAESCHLVIPIALHGASQNSSAKALVNVGKEL